MDGEIIQLMPVGPLHAVLVGLIAELLAELFRRHGFHVRQEKPVRLNSYYDPLPDVAVVKGRLLDYRDRFPRPDEVVLVTEVADSSLEYDRSDKMAAYAAAGIETYWVANLREMQIEVYREPSGAEYLSRRVHKLSDSIPSPIGPETSITVAALLGRE